MRNNPTAFKLIKLSALAAAVLLAPVSGEARDYGNKYQKHQSAHKAGRFDYYNLVLSWSPTYCAAEGKDRREQQCAGERPYAFVLHGLWPQYKKGWPEHCPTKKSNWVPKELINSMLDIMPSRKLIIHEYKKHGTCSGLSPENYYKASRILYKSVVIPPRYRAPEKPLLVSPKEIEDDFLIANPKLKPEMISIVCDKRSLREVRICFTRKGHLTACGKNEYQKKLCNLPKIYLPPVRYQRKKKGY